MLKVGNTCQMGDNKVCNTLGNDVALGKMLQDRQCLCRILYAWHFLSCNSDRASHIPNANGIYHVTYHEFLQKRPINNNA